MTDSIASPRFRLVALATIPWVRRARLCMIFPVEVTLNLLAAALCVLTLGTLVFFSFLCILFCQTIFILSAYLWAAQ
jgi:hypothetical protein